MRTTIYIEDRLLKKVKADAVREGMTLTAYTEAALKNALARKKSAKSKIRVKLPVFNGDGLKPGIDISDTDALLDIMDNTG